MATVASYERPETLEAALAALRRPGAAALGGGTLLNARPGGGPLALVDLQGLGLDRIEALPAGRLRIGAGVTLQALAEHPAIPRAVREAARREVPSTLRAAATVGGCLAAAEGDSELFAALLVHDSAAETAGGVLVTGVEIATDGSCAWARTARTRADRPIVAAFARRGADGKLRLALAGVAAQPLLVEPEELDRLEPPGDFRGSREYRRELALTLARRVLEEVG